MVKPRKPARSREVKPKIRLFTPLGWGTWTSPTHYLGHLLVECGRLGFRIDDITRRSTNAVLSDLLDWLGARNNRGFEQLYNWLHIDRRIMAPRFKKDPNVRPRIEITAKITKKDNLSVVWHPGGWDASTISLPSGRDPSNQISHRQWRRPPDFWWFTGDESPYFDQRASNELMYIRGVGNLRPQPLTEYGYYAEFNHDVVDAILICAVRAAYEGLVQQLQENFDVTPITSFDFETREEDTKDTWYTVSRVTTWTIENTLELKRRQERAKAEKRAAEASEGLAAAVNALRVSPEMVSAALIVATQQFKGTSTPSDPTLDKHAAKLLIADGHIVDEKDVRRIRRFLQICRLDLVPEHLRPGPPNDAEPPDNVVPFK